MNNLNEDSFVVTDKAPQNFVWIGFIKMFFPDAKIIHSKRNYKDIFLSNYKNNFVSNDMDWSYDPDDILKYMLMLADDPNLAKQIGVDSSEWFKQHNGVALVKKWLEIINCKIN